VTFSILNLVIFYNSIRMWDDLWRLSVYFQVNRWSG